MQILLKLLDYISEVVIQGQMGLISRSSADRVVSLVDSRLSSHLQPLSHRRDVASLSTV